MRQKQKYDETSSNSILEASMQLGANGRKIAKILKYGLIIVALTIPGPNCFLIGMGYSIER